MSDKLQHTPEVTQTSETNQDILAKQSESVKQIIANNPILSKNLDQITNPEKFFDGLAQNAHIFDRTDNLAAQKTFLEQSLKGLGYGQYTKDGRKFEDLSDEEVGKLDDADATTYLIWLEKKENEQRQKTIMVQEKRQDVQARNQQEQIGLQQDEANLIKAGKLNESCRKQITIVESTLSDDGKTLIDQEFQKAKTDKNNPVYRDLITKGIDPNRGEYDNILRASIILSNIDELRKEATNKDAFEKSIGELRKLEIPVDISFKIDAINAHIDARFPKDENTTERARAEIVRSIEGGSVTNIYYDGRGEKYTLVDKDGTSKEVYMNPPKIKVYRESLSVSADLPDQNNHVKRLQVEKEGKRIFTANQEKIGNFFDAVKNRTTKEEAAMINGTNKEQIQKYFATLSGPSTIETKENAVKELRGIYSQARDKVDLNIESVLSQDFTANISPKDVFDNRLFQLREIEMGIEQEKEVRDKYRAIPQDTTNMAGFEKTAKSNLSTLTEINFHKVGPRAQEALDRVIAEYNQPPRNEQNKIKLGEEELKKSEKDYLTTSLEKLGGKKGVFEDADRLARFRLDIDKALALPADHPLSLESQINGTYEKTYSNG